MLRRIRSLSTLALLPALAVAACGGDKFPTPLEKAEGDVLTSYEDMISFLGELQAGTGAFTIDTIGTSTEGRSLLLLHFTGGGEGASVGGGDRVRLLMYAQQHGNEPSGKEASIALARDIATGQFVGFLGSVDLYLIPQVNPDGSEARRRQNAGGMDLNRDHLTLTTPEVQALHKVFGELMPEATLDVHEYGIAGRTWEEAGMHKRFGQQIDALTNPNMSLAVRNLALERMIPEMREKLAPRNVDLHRYLVTDGPAARFRHSTAALNDGRNSMGIYNTLSYLIEGRNGLTVEEDIRERAREQLETMKAFITFASDHAAEVKELVARERAALRGEAAPREVALVMDYVADPEQPTLSVGVTNLETGAAESLVIEAYHPLVETTLSVTRPLGYVVPADLTDVLAVLERHRIETTPASGSVEAVVESYRITSLTQGWKEDKDFLEVGVTARRRAARIPEGAVIVWCDQPATNLIAILLEPQSQFGLAPLPEFVSMLKVGSDYPIQRIVEVKQ
jgi:hypothetical protein